jgi:hypothetical protein
MTPGLITEIRVLDQVLAGHTNQLGPDFVGYRNDAYRVANPGVMLAPTGRDQIEKIAIAAAFHDLGIWTDETFDYLEPSVRLTRAYLTGTQIPLWSPEPLTTRQHSEPYLFNHVMRAWLFAVRIAELAEKPHDAEVLAVATVLHDVSLSGGVDRQLRFEVEGANAARDFARENGLDDRRAQLIWDSVALNSTPSIALYKETEVALCSAGTVLDWSGEGSDKLTNDQMARILEAFPRLEMKRRFTDAVCRIVKMRPGPHTTTSHGTSVNGSKQATRYHRLSITC